MTAPGRPGSGVGDAVDAAQIPVEPVIWPWDPEPPVDPETPESPSEVSGHQTGYLTTTTIPETTETTEATIPDLWAPVDVEALREHVRGGQHDLADTEAPPDDDDFGDYTEEDFDNELSEPDSHPAAVVDVDDDDDFELPPIPDDLDPAWKAIDLKALAAQIRADRRKMIEEGIDPDAPLSDDLIGELDEEDEDDWDPSDDFDPYAKLQRYPDEPTATSTGDQDLSSQAVWEAQKRARDTTDHDEMMQLVAHPSQYVRAELANNQAATSEILEALVQTGPSQLVRWRVLMHSNCPHHILKGASLNDWLLIASRPDIDTDLAAHALVQSKYALDVALALATNPDLGDVPYLDQTMDQAPQELLAALATNPDTPGSVLSMLTGRGPVLRKLVLANPCCPEHIRAMMALGGNQNTDDDDF